MIEKNRRQFCISVAGHTAAIAALHTRVYKYCDGYISDETPEIFINIEEGDILQERVESAPEKIIRKDDYLETLVVCRKLSEAMLTYDTFLMHGAVVAAGDASYMFTADSGTGKTTHIKKWLEYAEGAFVVNGDKPLIRITDTQAIACGTPWSGKEHMNTNIMVPLRGIALMERAENNVIEEISYSQAFAFLLKQTYWPKDINKMKKTLSLVSQMKGKVRFFKFRFNNMKEDAFHVAFKAMTGT